MSKAKTKGDKGSKNQAPTPAITHEIVPGKYSDYDWNQMIEHDSGGDFVLEIVEEICASTMKVIYDNYIQKQAVPYTVAQAKDAILQIIEWQFLAKDPGETEDSDIGWIEDEEPSCSITDCWAQGSVPRSIATHLYGVDEETEAQIDDEVAKAEECEEEEEILTVEEPIEDSEPEVPITPPDTKTEKDKQIHVKDRISVASPMETKKAGRKPFLLNVDCSPFYIKGGIRGPGGRDHRGMRLAYPQVVVYHDPATRRKSNDRYGHKNVGKYKPHTGQLRAADSRMSESLEDFERRLHQEGRGPSPEKVIDERTLAIPAACQTMLKLQAGRPPGTRDVVYDEFGNVIKVTKLNPNRLPLHSVKTGYSIVDPKVEIAKQRLDALRKGKFRAVSLKPQPPCETTSRIRHLTPRAPHPPGNTMNLYGKQKDHVVSLPPPLIETMDVSPGVVVKEGSVTKCGPRMLQRKPESLKNGKHVNLQPVVVKPHRPSVTVQELLDCNTPIVRPLPETPPVPPIMSHSQHAVRTN